MWEIKSLTPNEVVKTAGVLRRIKKFLKQVFDPEYRAQLLAFEANTKQLQDSAKYLYQSLNKLQEAIGDGNLNQYTEAFDTVQALTVKFWEEVSRLKSEKDGVANILRYYTSEEMAHPGFGEKIQQTLPKEFDLPLGAQSTAVSSTRWYGALQPSDIQIRGEGDKSIENRLLNEIKRVLVGFKLIPEETIVEILSNPELLTSFKRGILGGTVVDIRPKKPGNIQQIQYGQLDTRIVTAPFEVPGTSVRLTCEVVLIDSRPINPERALSLKSVLHMAPTRTAFRLEQLVKLAQQIPYHKTILSDLDLAQALKQGYQQVFGREPTAEALAGGWSQVVLEAGEPVSLPGNNMGNIKASNDWLNAGKPFFIKDTKENNAEGHEYTEHGTKWRAYNTPVEGAVGYWQFLGKGYANALDWMAAGDPTSATVNLGLKGYFTANIKRYAAGVGSLYQKFMTQIAPQLGVKSMPIDAPGEKPEVKDLASHYTPQEKQAILQHTDTSSNSPDTDLDSLMQELYADEPLTSMVKLAQAEEILPTVQVKVLLATPSIRFLKALGEAIPEVLQGQVVGSSCQVIGMPLTVLGAVQAICDCIAIAEPQTQPIVIIKEIS